MSKIKSKALYSSPFSLAYWRDAAAELKDVRVLVFAALMIAIRVALKTLGIPIAADLRINIAFFINALGAMVFGPVVAVLAAAISDTLGCIIAPQGAYFFPFIFTEIAGSLIFALFLYRTKVTATRVILSRFCVNFFVNILLNIPIMWAYYKFVLGKSYVLFQLPRVIKNLALFPLESVLLILFLSAMIPLAYKMHLVYSSSDGLKMSKKQVVLLVSLFVIGSGCVGGYFVYDYNTGNHASDFTAADYEDTNTALGDALKTEALMEDGCIAVTSKVYKKLGGDTTVLFTVYSHSETTDLATAASYSAKKASADETLTEVRAGTAVFTEGDLASAPTITLD